MVDGIGRQVVSTRIQARSGNPTEPPQWRSPPQAQWGQAQWGPQQPQGGRSQWAEWTRTTSQATQPPKKKRGRAVGRAVARIVKWVLVAGVVVIVIVVIAAAVGAAHKKAATRTVTGVLVLYDTSSAQASCNTSGTGYEDISEGTPVSITNENGKVVGAADLGAGTRLGGDECDFSWTATGVGPATFYQVTISHRGTVSYSESEMESDGWSVKTTLGHPGN